MDYPGLNNIIRKNQYLLRLIKETLNGILKIRYFIKLNITAAVTGRLAEVIRSRRWIGYNAL